MFGKKENQVFMMFLFRNIIVYYKDGVCNFVRLLSTDCKVYNVIIDEIIDTSPKNICYASVVRIGKTSIKYGNYLLDGVSNIAISNIISKYDTVVNV